MFCKNCGNKLNEKASFCPNCGTKVEEKKVEKVEEKKETPTVNTTNNGTTNVVNDSDKKLSTTLTVISIICHYGIAAVLGTISSILDEIRIANSFYMVSGSLMILSYLASFVLVIIAIVKNKKNKFPIIMLIVYIAEIFIFIIGLVILYAACIYACENFPY